MLYKCCNKMGGISRRDLNIFLKISLRVFMSEAAQSKFLNTFKAIKINSIIPEVLTIS